MIRKFILTLSLLALTNAVHASLIVTSPATGADMVGLEVTVNYEDSTSSSAIWQMVADNGGLTPVAAEGRSGRAFVAGEWELSQAGYTLGAIDNGIFYGDWVLNNFNNVGITSLILNGLSSGFVFDILSEGDGGPEYTPGSGNGLAFVTQFVGAVGSYSDQLDPAFGDLFYTLTVDFSAPVQSGQEVVFFADVDQVTVPAPSTLAIMICGLLIAVRRSSKVLNKA
jgi:hypothetical protein